MSFWPYVAAYPPCSGRALPGTANLQLAILDRFDRSLDFGIYNCRPSTTSPNVPSIHSDGRAGDVGFPVYNGQPHAQGFALVELLRRHSSTLGIMGIIWNRRRFDWRTPWGREYTGPSPHVDHVHWEQTPSIAWSLTAATADRLIGEQPMAFTPQEEQALRRLAPYADILALLGQGLNSPGPTTGKVGNGYSLIHLLEVHRIVSDKTGVSPTDHLNLATRLLGQ